mmetsp:Transcript_5312/g.14990  ORF Transcript_5312/g.14990 Transcript_5312/m.14990 type:complete len:98 (-) Transcript_5312:74-367(-)
MPRERKAREAICEREEVVGRLDMGDRLSGCFLASLSDTPPRPPLLGLDRGDDPQAGESRDLGEGVAPAIGLAVERIDGGTRTASSPSSPSDTSFSLA